ncbi:ISAs1 family transposase [Streptomyces sp. NPDC056149]|uniref:ISAs1 family transposase n=1 Tax=Streptomyces sp. NPDC056149 TaxID=3345728 RepID=UPI0035D76615
MASVEVAAYAVVGNHRAGAGAIDGDVLDGAVGSYLAERHHRATAGAGLRVIAVDGKALKGSARLDDPRRHLLSAVTHGCVATLAQVEVGAKTNETRHFKPLLTPLDLADMVVTFDALHSVKANITWLVKTKKAHYIAVIKTNQPTVHQQLAALPWHQVAVQHTHSASGHGRRESRSIKTCSIADTLGGIAFPHAKLALCVHRRRKETGKRESRESVYAVISLDAHQAGPAELAAAIRGHWGIENRLHFVRDVTFDEDRSQVRTGRGPENMATLRNLAINKLRAHGHATSPPACARCPMNPSPAPSTSSASPRDQQLRHDQRALQQPWQSARVSLYHRRSRKTVAGCRLGAEIPQLEFQRRR